MSTFDGIVEEFPDVRVDYFRHHATKSPPKACFLSHIHSDHLQGLESLRMPFVYCSHVTRSLLLKMEKYPHRINFSKGILEARKQTYNNLKKLLRPLPLDTPVTIELDPKTRIRVTLFDANHCPGAVMFLIEGDGKAILYTGDIRSEEWWVNALIRSPSMVPYAAGLKALDCIYLDTTFASHQDIHRDFPSKAAGLTELIRKIRRCRNGTKFYFRAWTLGYEDVWLTLSNELDAKVHVDPYQYRLFRAAAEDAGSALVGFKVGNMDHPGCLTTDRNVQIHSCEPGTSCHAELKKDKNIVWITPIISRLRDGTELAEIGAGGGKGDLYQRHEVELNNLNPFILESLRKLCNSLAGDDAATKLRNMLAIAQEKDEKLPLEGVSGDESEMSIKEFLRLVTSQRDERVENGRAGSVIHFPYSRHSSYSELRHLVKELQPRDVYPCTVGLDHWEELNLSMESLFGDLCSGREFKYDVNIREELARQNAANGGQTEAEFDTQRTESVTEEYFDVAGDKDKAAPRPDRGVKGLVSSSAVVLDNEESMLAQAPSNAQADRNSQATTDAGTETEVEDEGLPLDGPDVVKPAKCHSDTTNEATAQSVSQKRSRRSSPDPEDIVTHVREHADSQDLLRKRQKRTPGEKLRDAWYRANGGDDIYVPAEDRAPKSQVGQS